MLVVTGRVEVDFDVSVEGPAREVSVIATSVTADGWDAGDSARCPRCGWAGTVGDICLLAMG